MNELLKKVYCKDELPPTQHKEANVSIDVFTNEGRCFYKFDTKEWFSYEITRTNKYIEWWWKPTSEEEIIKDLYEWFLNNPKASIIDEDLIKQYLNK